MCACDCVCVQMDAQLQQQNTKQIPCIFTLCVGKVECKKRKSSESTKACKENKALDLFLWKIHFDDPIYVCLYNIRMFLLIVLDKCANTTKTQIRKAEGQRNSWVWIALTHRLPLSHKKKLFRSFAMMKLHFCIFNESYSRACTSAYAYCMPTHACNPIQSNLFMHRSVTACYCIIFI